MITGAGLTMRTRSQTRAASVNAQISSSHKQGMLRQCVPNRGTSKYVSRIKLEVKDTMDVELDSHKDDNEDIIILDDSAFKRPRERNGRSTICPQEFGIPSIQQESDVHTAGRRTSIPRTADTNRTSQEVVYGQSKKPPIKPVLGKNQAAPVKMRSTPAPQYIDLATSSAVSQSVQFIKNVVPDPATKLLDFPKVGTPITSQSPEFIPLQGIIVVLHLRDSNRLANLKALVAKLGGTTCDSLSEQPRPDILVSDHKMAEQLDLMKVHNSPVEVTEEFLNTLPPFIREAVRLKIRVRFFATFEKTFETLTRKAEAIRTKAHTSRTVAGLVNLNSPYIKFECASTIYKPYSKELDPAGKNFAQLYLGQYMGASLFQKSTEEVQAKRLREIEQEKLWQKRLDEMQAAGNSGYPTDVMPLTRPRPVRDVGKGFCEICAKHTHNLKEHVMSKEHKAIINSPGFYAEVDAVLGSFVDEISCPGFPQLEREEAITVPTKQIYMDPYEFCDGPYKTKKWLV